ncbi:branched-chain amino acid ABC transporter permease [Effusibacillus dendaii]|uniref:Branched-chain amino acid ABC transporter permease n=1 Tax=Effusibacillus dendaii TaxID=2743772 RepID=A0A7I8D5Q5_9BACL|nr:branched-chain amino acid ABC transporter permease [Effusibacillus dendaii]BCJ85483.1 branched-chain amino acid ABC transporter permease [Effusibacillus dendaii]
MTDFVQLLVAGLAIGGIYALLALGFVWIYVALDAVNFAQGDFAMIAAYLVFTFSVQMRVPYGLAIVLGLLSMILLGIIFQLLVYVPFRDRSKNYLPVMISTLGASILLQNLVLMVYGPFPQQLPNIFPAETVHVGGVVLSTQYLLILGVTFALLLVQYILFEKTLIGKKMQATAQDKLMARLLGISVNTMIMLTFMYSTVLAGVAGILVAPLFMVTNTMGVIIALKAFSASIIGGFSSVPGAIIGGLGIGLIETFAAAYLSEPYKDAFAFLILIVFLLIRPQGLFGEKIAQKA